VKAAIDVLAARPGKRVLILGDMGELGIGAAQLHRDVGSYARERGIDALWVTGRFAVSTAQGFGSGAQVCDSKQQLAAQLESTMDSTTTLLVKGSRSAGMEEVVNLIIEEQS